MLVIIQKAVLYSHIESAIFELPFPDRNDYVFAKKLVKLQITFWKHTPADAGSTTKREWEGVHMEPSR